MDETLILKAISLASLIVAVIIHEISHGYVALLCGDPTARDAGRISLNPIRHIDPIGTIILPLILTLTHSPMMFGWAKPVPVNVGRCRNPRQAFWMTAIAGPLSNLIQALIAVGIYYLILPIANAEASSVFINYAQKTCVLFATTNIVLMTLNLIPIPPLDGSRVMAMLLPKNLAIPYMRLERFGFIILIILLNLGVFSSLIGRVLFGFLTLSGMNFDFLITL